MKQTLLFLLLFTGIVNAQVINFTDPNLKTALINSPFVMDLNDNFLTSADMNFDGEIDMDEASQIGTIMAENSNISNLSGMEFFTNLKSFSCADNQITDLTPLMNMVWLHQLYVQNNQITSIDFSAGFNQLTDFTFDGNTITYLDLSGCSSLTYINPLVTANLVYFNIHGCSSLTTFNVTSSDLAFIDFTGCSALNNLTIWSSQLTSLDFSDLNVQTINLQSNNLLSSLTFHNNPNLSNLYVLGGVFTTLDISDLPVISAFSCSNNPVLQTIFAKNGSNESMFVGNNPSLQFICADDFQVQEIQTYLNNNGLTSVVCSSYCNFTPGGNYNTIAGHVKFDGNNNGCDAADIIPKNVRINISGADQGASFVGNAGDYIFYTQEGNFDITPSVENPSYFNFSPASANVVFADDLNHTETRDFCITANGIHHDAEMVISPYTAARPGFDAVYKLIYKNKGNQTDDLWLNFTFNDNLLDFVSSSIPVTHGVGSVQVMVPAVRPFESGSVDITLHVHAPTDIPAVNIGDVLTFSSFVDIVTDENWTDNAFSLHQTVIGSLDPNEITCLEGNVVADSNIGNYLHYAIDFENTGTFQAENIVVRSEINPTQFNLNSLQLMYASHPVEARLTGYVAEFIFKNIDLTIGGHGHILLKMKSNSALHTGSTVANRADIFFDYNFPVDTGIETTVFQTLSNMGFETDNSVMVMPNPAFDMVLVKSDHNILSVALYDVQGRIVSSSSVNENESKINLSQYAPGVYFVKVMTEKGSKVNKIVKK